jgi:hypothetical protein
MQEPRLTELNWTEHELGWMNDQLIFDCRKQQDFFSLFCIVEIDSEAHIVPSPMSICVVLHGSYKVFS